MSTGGGREGGGEESAPLVQPVDRRSSKTSPNCSPIHDTRREEQKQGNATAGNSDTAMGEVGSIRDADGRRDGAVPSLGDTHAQGFVAARVAQYQQVRPSAWGNDSDDEIAMALPPSTALGIASAQRSGWNNNSDEEGVETTISPISASISRPQQARMTTWGDDSDDDNRVDTKLPRLFAPNTSSNPFESKGFDERVASGQGLQDRQLQGPTLVEERTSAAWGDDDDEEDNHPSPLSQPFRMGAAAIADGKSLPLSPDGIFRNNSYEEVIVPSPVPYENIPDYNRRSLSWADEDRDGVGTRAGGHDQDASFTANVPRQGAAGLFSSTFSGRSSIPSTAAHTPWSNTFRPFFARKQSNGGAIDDDDDDDDDYYDPYSIGTRQAVPDGGWFGRWSASNTFSQRRLGPLGMMEGSPLHAINGSAPPKQPCGDDVFTAYNRRPPSVVPPASPTLPMRPRRRWFQRALSRFAESRQIRQAAHDESPCGKGKEDVNDSGVRTWTWWDNFKNAPGLVARLCACVLAVCALWLTSLSVAVEVTSRALPSPSLNQVIAAIYHAYFVVEEQRKAYEKCVDRQSVYCDSDIETFSATARVQSIESLALTAATLEQANEWTESCEASVLETEVSLKTWLAQGSGHVALYSGNCDSADEGLVADLLGDVSTSREGLVSANADFARDSVTTVAALSSYALERSEYDVAYAANSSKVVFVYAENLIGDVDFEIPDSIASALDDVVALGDTLVSCVSLNGDVDGAPCPGDGARKLADQARAELDAQLAAARIGFQQYANTFNEYTADATAAYNNMILFYEGVTEALSNQVFDISFTGEWSVLTAADFFIPYPGLPSTNGVLDGITGVPTAEEIWAEVSGAYSVYSESVAAHSAVINAEVASMAETWKDVASEAVTGISVAFDLDDYDPPRYGNSSTDNTSNTLLESENAKFETRAEGYSEKSLAFLDGLGPAAANRSFPTAPALNSTFKIGDPSTVLSVPIKYNFAAFASGTPKFGSWTASIGNLGVLLLVADYVFRFTSSVRLFIRFWGRGGLGLPDADMRVDKHVAGASGVIGNARKGAIQIILSPITTVVFFAIVVLFMVYNMGKLYVPLFNDYRAGCVDRTQTGSFFSQNVYSVAYNYAADRGNRDLWSYQESHTSQRSALCVELTANVRQYLTETDLLLRQMYETHYDDVTLAATLGTCLDTPGMDALYEEACCGRAGYGNCTATSAFKCPLNYSSGGEEAFAPVGLALSNEACAKETLETAYWEVEEGIQLDCDSIPTCEMTCSGPNEELVRVLTMHAGCMTEWLFHAGWLKGVVTLVMFAFLNFSRVIIVGGIVKANWRLMHTGIFTYKGTCTRAGELVVKQPDQKVKKSKQVEAKEKKRKLRKGDSSSNSNSPSSQRPKTKGKLGGSPPQKETKGAAKADSEQPAAVPKREPTTFKRIIARAVEEGLNSYERSSWLRIYFGVLINMPWIFLLWYVSGGTAVYQADL